MAGWAAALGVAGAVTTRRDLAQSGERGLHAAALFTAISTAGLAYALAVGELQLRYVANWASSTTPLAYRLGAVWAGPSGSLLVWATMLAFGAVLGAISLPRDTAVRQWTVAILALLLLSVLLMAGFDTNPWTKLANVPDDGHSLPLEWVRPIVLLQMKLGYLAMALAPVPAVMTVMGALGRETSWRSTARRWSLVVLSLLSLAIALDWRRRYGLGLWADSWRWAPLGEGTLLAWFGAAALTATLVLEVRAPWRLAASFAAFAFGLGGLTVRRAGGLAVDAFVGTPLGSFVFIGAVVFLVALGLSLLFVPAARQLGRTFQAFALAVLAVASGLVASGFGVSQSVPLAEGGRVDVHDRFGTTWSLSLEGLSTVGRGSTDLAIAAVRAAVNGRSRAFVTAERRELYQGDSRRPVEELAVSGISGGTVQDLRVDLRESSRSEALLDVRFVPLVSLVWLGAAGAVLALAAAAMAPSAAPTAAVEMPDATEGAA